MPTVGSRRARRIEFTRAIPSDRQISGVTFGGDVRARTVPPKTDEGPRWATFSELVSTLRAAAKKRGRDRNALRRPSVPKHGLYDAYVYVRPHLDKLAIRALYDLCKTGAELPGSNELADVLTAYVMTDLRFLVHAKAAPLTGRDRRLFLDLEAVGRVSRDAASWALTHFDDNYQTESRTSGKAGAMKHSGREIDPNKLATVAYYWDATNAELAAMCACSERTIKRYRKLIREERESAA